MECFAVYTDNIEGRIDPLYLKNVLVLEKIKTKFSLMKLGSLLKHDVQYGANESAINGDPEKDVRYIRITDIDEFGNLKNNDWKTSQIIEKKYELNEGDILFARSGATAGKCFYYKNEYGKSIFAGYLIRFVFDEKKVNPKYIFYYSQLNHFKLWVITIQRPSGQPNINSEEFKSFKIPLPPLSIQNHIVKIMETAYKIKKQKEAEAEQLLDSIDEYILNELGIKLPELKDKMCYSVSSYEVKGKRIDAYYHHPKFEEVVNAIERGKYDVKELNEYIEFIPGFAFSSNYYVKDTGTKLLTIKNIKKDGIDFSDVTLLPNDFYDKFSKFQIRQDDILFAMTGATIGKVNIFKTKERALLNQRVGILRVIDNEINNYYLFSFMNTRIFKNKIIRQSCGGAQPNISESEITSIEIPYPPVKIQNKIAEEVKRRMQKAEGLQKEAKQLLEEAKEKAEEMILGE